MAATAMPSSMPPPPPAIATFAAPLQPDYQGSVTAAAEGRRRGHGGGGPSARSSPCSRRCWCSPCCPASSAGCARATPTGPTSGTTAPRWLAGGAAGVAAASPGRQAAEAKPRRPWWRRWRPPPSCHRRSHELEIAAASASQVVPAYYTSKLQASKRITHVCQCGRVCNRKCSLKSFCSSCYH